MIFISFFNKNSRYKVSGYSLYLFIMFEKKPSSVTLIGGILLVIIGLFWLFESLNVTIPPYVFSFETLTIIGGIVVLIYSKFKSEWGYLLLTWGIISTANKLYPGHNILDIGVSTMLIIFGVYFIYKYQLQKKNFRDFKNSK